MRGACLYFAIVAGLIIGAVSAAIVADAPRLTANRHGTVGMIVAGASLLLSALLLPSVKLAARPSRSGRVE